MDSNRVILYSWIFNECLDFTDSICGCLVFTIFEVFQFPSYVNHILLCNILVKGGPQSVSTKME